MLYPSNDKDIVNKMAGIVIEGNIIPDQWYIHLRNDKGKIQTNAALILAHVVYWYRPVPMYDIKTGQISGYGKKFKEDLLQISYEDLEQKFKFSKNQIRSALKFLEEKQLIFREFRDIKVERHALNNVMYIGINPDKLLEITGNRPPSSSITNFPCEPVLETPLNIQTATEALLTPKSKPKEKDWSSNFSPEQKEFLSHLLNLKPELGDSIQKNDATWWIKSFGIEKIKIALEVYWQRVEKARKDSTVPMPQSIGKYVRTALNNGTQPNRHSQLKSKESDNKKETFSHPYSKNLQEGVTKMKTGLEENVNTNTEISLTSLTVSEVNDGGSLTFQEEGNTTRPPTLNKNQDSSNNLLAQVPIETKFKALEDEFLSFNKEEKNYLKYLINIRLEKGTQINRKTAISWIKEFGIQKIKTSLQVYWQQVEKAKKDTNEILPNSIVEYLQGILNRKLEPNDEVQLKNKHFAENFKNQMNWPELDIGDKDCRIYGQTWSYFLPEEMFKNTLVDYHRCYIDMNEAFKNLEAFSLSTETINQFEEMSKIDLKQCVATVSAISEPSNPLLISDIIEPSENIESFTQEKDTNQSIHPDKIIADLTFARFPTDEKVNKLKTLSSEVNSQYSNSKKMPSKRCQKRKNKEDWSFDFKVEQKEFLSYLLNFQPERGESIARNTATYWIRHFGIEKIKIALQVYEQQVEKARKNPNIRMPDSVGAYVRTALNEGLRPCQEIDRCNKAFAKHFKETHKWFELTLTEKYCRIEGFGKELHYHLPQQVFEDCLIECYKNCCVYEEKFQQAV